MTHLRKLLKQPSPDADLGTTFEALAAAEPCLGSLGWLWGPALYEQDRILFKPLIMGRLASSYIDHKNRWQPVRWKGEVGKHMDAWLAKADSLDDIRLVRRLIDWQTSGSPALCNSIVMKLDRRIRAMLDPRLKAFRRSTRGGSLSPNHNSRARSPISRC